VNWENREGRTALHLAVGTSRDITTVLLDVGADVSAVARVGETVLTAACRSRSCLSISELLLDRGALYIHDKMDSSHVELLCGHRAQSPEESHEKLECVRLLLSYMRKSYGSLEKPSL
jgi:ankyrin repeat protein